MNMTTEELRLSKREYFQKNKSNWKRYRINQIAKPGFKDMLAKCPSWNKQYRSEKAKEYNNQPEIKQKMKVKNSRLWLDPQYRERRKEYRKIRDQRPEAKIKNAANKRKYNIKRLTEWLKIIPEITKCGCCEKQISFLKRPDMGIIHFDHRQGGIELIQKTPRKWLKSHSYIAENLAIWLSCNFGHLCIRCNQLLPTRDRLEFLKHAIQYVEGN